MTSKAIECCIRPAQVEDVTAIQAIYAVEVSDGTASFELEPPAVDEMARRREAIITLGLPYLVAELDNQIAGYAYAGAYRPRPAYRYTVEDSVYIAAWARRRGVGLALLSELIERCQAGPWRQMVAVIGDSAHTASIKLHQEAGFRQIGTIQSVGFKHGRWLDSVLMQRALGTGDSELPEV